MRLVIVIVRFVETPYLHFEYVCTKPEYEVLPTKPKADKQCNQTLSAPNKKINSKVTPEIVKKMKQMADSGMSQGEIGNKLNISRRTVNKILSSQSKIQNGRKWQKSAFFYIQFHTFLDYPLKHT